MWAFCTVGLNSLQTKFHTNQPKKTLSDRLELEKCLTKSLNTMLCSISKQSFPKLLGQLMPRTGVISGVVTPKDKTKSQIPLLDKKSGSYQNLW